MKSRMLVNITFVAFAAGVMPTSRLCGQVAVLDVTIRNVRETSPNCMLGSSTCRTFVVTGEIVAVNGQTLGGSWTQTSGPMNLQASGKYHGLSLTPLYSISEQLDFLGADGASIGGISATYYALDIGEVLVPSTMQAFGNSGIYLGAQGYMTRHASYQRSMNNSIGKLGTELVVTLLSAQQPMIATVGDSPAVFDATMTLVSSTNPARIGQSITLLVRGLGLATPDPGEGTFPADPVAKINAPLQVIVGEKAAEVITAVGWPGQIGVYRVDLRIPDDVKPGLAVVQLIAGFIPSVPVEIPVQ